MCWEGRWRLGPPSTTATVYTLSRDVEDVGFGSGRAWQLVLMTWGLVRLEKGPDRQQTFRDSHSDRPTLARQLPSTRAIFHDAPT